MQSQTDTAVIDARGLRCPWPVLRAAKALRADGLGSGVIIVADDPIAPAELAAYALEHGLKFEATETALGAGFRLSPKRSDAK